MATPAGTGGSRLSVAGIELEVVRRGIGPPLLMLHGFESPDPRHPYLEHCARGFELIAPSHPGFGASPRPAGFESVYDLVQLYLAVIDSLPGDKIALMGLSFGGWLAAEIATLRPHKLSHLILVDALGIRISDPATPDILDVFNRHPDEVRKARWHDAARFAPDYDAMTDEELITVARNRDALCLYGWHPYMHNPRLKRWLAKIGVPTLVLWGESDAVVTPAYGKAYADLIPGARFVTIPKAGHHPEIEHASVFAGCVLDFLHYGRAA